MMTGESFLSNTGRKIIVTGHYGSGKTEFSVSLAMLLAAKANTENASIAEASTIKTAEKIAIVDLDIVNPYFRSRERREMLEEAGVSVYGSAFDFEVTAELPALGATLRAPLEDKNCRVIIDSGGNDSGALALNQFTKYFTGGDITILAIVNANRPDTSDLDGVVLHISAIESATGLNITGIVNNCHMLRETTAETILKGHRLCKSVCEATGKQLFCDCYPDGIVKPEELSGLSGNLMPMGLYMRPTWQDK
jgi:energy-coupling factor transporter ATP-binding protein EcfA2